MWIDLHREYARERHDRFLREGEQARLAASLRPERRCRRLRLGRLELFWNCRVVRETG